MTYNSPNSKIVVISGGFKEDIRVQCNNETIDIDPLRAMQEEADTRIMLHIMHTSSKFVCVMARDTDILIIMLGHNKSIHGKDVWMKSGTMKKPKDMSLKKIITQNTLSNESLELLIPFHAITGCDTTSFMYGQNKVVVYS